MRGLEGQRPASSSEHGRRSARAPRSKTGAPGLGDPVEARAPDRASPSPADSAVDLAVRWRCRCCPAARRTAVHVGRPAPEVVARRRAGSDQAMPLCHTWSCGRNRLTTSPAERADRVQVGLGRLQRGGVRPVDVGEQVDVAVGDGDATSRSSWTTLSRSSRAPPSRSQGASRPFIRSGERASGPSSPAATGSPVKADA